MSLRQRIISLHGEKMLRKSALRLGDAEAVFAAAMGGPKIRTAVEIGTYRGVSAAVMARHADRVVTIDLYKGKIERNGTRFDRYAFWASLGIANIDFVAVADDADKARFLASLDFAFAFIDGNHDTRAVAADFGLVMRCGRVLFHDAAEGPASVFVRSLPAQDVIWIDAMFALWTAPAR